MEENKNIETVTEVDYDEIELDDLMSALNDNLKDDIKDFTDIINLQGALNREVYLGDICDGTGNSISGYINFWNDYDNRHNIPEEDRIPIKIYIHSYGGSLIDTFMMIDSIKMSKTPVWTIVTGAAYSGGFFIFIAGHKRIAYPHASFLFHEGATQNGGTASQFENYAKFYRVQLNQLKDIVKEYTNLDDDWYKEHQKEDIWWTTEEALELGIVDEIAEEIL